MMADEYLELSTAPLAAPCAGQERAARWVTHSFNNAFLASVNRLLEAFTS